MEPSSWGHRAVISFDPTKQLLVAEVRVLLREALVLTSASSKTPDIPAKAEIPIISAERQVVATVERMETAILSEVTHVEVP